MHAISLSATDLAIAASLVLLDAAMSLAFGLRLHRQLLVASVRMVVQLLLIGFILRWLFASGSEAVTLAVIVLMIAAAAREVAVRPKQRLRKWGNYRIAVGGGGRRQHGHCPAGVDDGDSSAPVARSAAMPSR